MSDTQKHKKPNVPNLRFPEFEGEWEECRNENFGKVLTGNTPPTSVARYYENGHRLWASPADLGVDKYITNTQTKLSEEGFSKTRLVPKGATLVTCIGSTIGKMGMASQEISTNQQINAIIPNETTDSQYLYYAIQSQFPRYTKSIATQAVPIISKGSFEKLKNYRPHIDEQTKIGSFLDLLDRRIAIQSKVIEKYESLIKALYESLIPCEGVDSVQLGSLVQICKGKQLNAELLSETGLYYVMNGGIFPSGYYDTYNTPQNIISISEGGNSCGYVQFNHKPFWSGGHCYTLLNPNENKVHYKYLFHFLKCHQDDIMALRIGSGLPNIQKKDIEKYPIALPNYETQVQLASLFDTINCKKENGIESLRQYKIMKSFLLSELFI